jgi:hypothetical protein
MNYHAIANWLSTGGDGGISTFYFNETKTARGEGCAGFSDGAQVGNVKSIIESYPEYIGTCPGPDLDAIDV